MSTLSPPKVQRLFIIDDHPMVRIGISQIIDTQDDLEICGEIDGGDGAAEAILDSQADLVLLDLSLKNNASGLTVLRELRNAGITIPIVVVSMHDEKDNAERSLQAGANGYLMKNEPGPVLLDCVRKVLAGGKYLSPAMTQYIIDRVAGKHEHKDESSVSNLSQREMEVFKRIGMGLPSSEIAEDLGIRPSTVDVYRGNIKQKLGLKDGAQLAREAVRWVERNNHSLED